MRTQPRRFAFTLIELLVVIAIIAILASILFPVFARARENARRASCMSNMKQLGLSMMMYKQDYDGRFPSAGWVDNLPCPDGSGNMCGASWEVKIYPYVKSLQVYVCPSDSDRVWLGNNQGTGQISYGYNFVNLDFVNEAAIDKPSQMIMMADMQGTVTYALYQFNSYTSGIREISDRHLNGAVLNFVDGHVKWIKIARDSATDHTIPPVASQGIYWKADGSS